MRIFWLLGLTLSGLAYGQDEPRVLLRTQLEPSNQVLVGQPVRLRVDVLVTTWLTRAPVYPNLEIPGALAVLPEERPANLTERFEGRSWFGLSRSYLIYPQEPREYKIPPAEIVVHYGQAENPARLTLDPHSFRARIPDEARGLDYFIATTQLRLRQQLDRDLTGLKVGDSIQRVIQMEAEGTFAMFLPPVDFEVEKGLSVYPDPPKISDRSDNRLGFLGGERQESATYVIQEAGEYTLPSIQVYWWDLNSNRMRQEVLPPVEFAAGPNPEYVAEIPLPQEGSGEETPAPEPESWAEQAKRWLTPLALIAIVLMIGVRASSSLWQRFQRQRAERRTRYLESEAAAFDQVRDAVLRRDDRRVIGSLYRWTDRALPGPEIATLGRLAMGDQRLFQNLTALEMSEYARKPSAESWSARVLLEGLKLARQRMRSQARSSSLNQVRMPELNP